MENKKFMIDKIPAVRYGEASDRCFLYIHGKMGFKEEDGRSSVATLNRMIEYLGFLPMVMDSRELYQPPSIFQNGLKKCSQERKLLLIPTNAYFFF